MPYYTVTIPHHVTPYYVLQGVFITEQSLLEGDRKMNVMFCAQILDYHPRLMSRDQQRYRQVKTSISSIFSSSPSPTLSRTSGASSSTGGGSGSVGMGVSMGGSGGTGEHDGNNTTVPSSSAPPPAPFSEFSKRSLDFRRDYARPEDNDDGVAESASCGLGLGIFSCVSRS